MTMLALIVATLLSASPTPADRATLATAGRVAGMIPAPDDRVWTLIAIAQRARDLGDITRARVLVEEAIGELWRLPKKVGYATPPRSTRALLEAASLADGCEHVVAWSERNLDAEVNAWGLGFEETCARGGFGAMVEPWFMQSTLSHDSPWMRARQFAEGGKLPANAVVERLDAHYRLPENDLATLLAAEGRATRVARVATGKACVAALWRLQGDAAKASAWAAPLMEDPTLVTNEGMFCLARAMPDAASWTRLSESIAGDHYERVRRYVELFAGMKREGGGASIAALLTPSFSAARKVHDLAWWQRLVVEHGDAQVRAAYVAHAKTLPADPWELARLWPTLMRFVSDEAELASLRATAAKDPDLTRIVREARAELAREAAKRARQERLTRATIVERVAIMKAETKTIAELASLLLDQVGTYGVELSEAERDALASLEGEAARRVAKDRRAYKVRERKLLRTEFGAGLEREP